MVGAAEGGCVARSEANPRTARRLSPCEQGKEPARPKIIKLMMTANEIRSAFLNFFEARGHKIVPSAPLPNQTDPTLMFVNSGMAPFKDCFLGNKTPIAPRVADTQKCLRVSGKHNDLEDVGMDGTHHTLFEMLGNWSFGDYFKEAAIAWSWELLTEVYKLPKDRLYATVFGGDTAENIPRHDKATAVWEAHLPSSHILWGNKKDNFWEMGAQGPCGPCSEIHFDMRSDDERAKVDGASLVNQDHPEVIEIWNNVFMMYNRKADGSLELLPSRHVDTGMGFERLCMAVQGKKYTYDTDVFTPLIGFVEAQTGIKYAGSFERSAKTDIAIRVVSDHIRAVAFTVADGLLPGAAGAGYVIRRILRRAVRYYYSFLGVKEPMMYQMVAILAENFGDTFPEIRQQQDFVAKVIQEEERSFLRTLEDGLRRLDNIEVTNGEIDGKTAFELLDSFGFPIDLTRLIAAERGLTVDNIGFEAALQEQRDRSRRDAQKQVGDWVVLRDEKNVQFVGYDQLETRTSYVTKYRTVVIKAQPQFQMVLNRTPFYPEGGGQSGDKGTLSFGSYKDKTEVVEVLDTKKENDLIYHIVDHLPEDISDETVRCQVNESRRRLVENNHSATHLLHAALRQVLGKHVQQKGSFLDETMLRFDFSHFAKVTDTEIAQIEAIVNGKIRENIAQDIRNISIEAARESGAMMLFGEKYGETVRMVTFDPSYSRELCGGCHVATTGSIGLLKITNESAVGAGVRRIEAVTALGAEQFVAAELVELTEIRSLFPNPKNLAKNVASLQDENKQLRREVEKMLEIQASALQHNLRGQIIDKNGVNFLATLLPLNDAKAIKTLAYNLEKEVGNAVFVFGCVSHEKPQLTVIISENLTKERGFHAGNMVRTLAAHIKGGGGGQPFFATAGGSDSSGLEAALKAAETMVL